MTRNRPRMDCRVAALLAVTDFLGALAHFAVTDFSGRGTLRSVGFLEADARHTSQCWVLGGGRAARFAVAVLMGLPCALVGSAHPKAQSEARAGWCVAWLRGVHTDRGTVLLGDLFHNGQAQA